MSEAGAAPLQLAAEANSTAHHVRDDLRDYKAEQAKHNRSIVQLVAKVDSRVTALANEITGWRGEQKGEARAQRRQLAILAFILGLPGTVVTVIHLAKLIASR